MFTRLFPLWVSAATVIALIEPSVFIWFSGPWITYGLGGHHVGHGAHFILERFCSSSQNSFMGGFRNAFAIYSHAISGVGIGHTIRITLFFCCWINLSCVLPWRDRFQCDCFFSQRQCGFICRHDHLLYLRRHSTHFFDCNPFRELFGRRCLGFVLQYPKSGVGSCKLGSIAQSICQKRNERILPFAPAVAVLLIVLIVASIIGQGKEIILSSGLNLIAAILTLHFLVSSWAIF